MALQWNETKKKTVFASGREETKEGGAVRWCSPDDRNGLGIPDRCQTAASSPEPSSMTPRGSEILESRFGYAVQFLIDEVDPKHQSFSKIELESGPRHPPCHAFWKHLIIPAAVAVQDWAGKQTQLRGWYPA